MDMLKLNNRQIIKLIKINNRKVVEINISLCDKAFNI